VRPRNVVIEGDALEMLGTLAAHSIDAVITSPPYFRARRYEAGPRELGNEEHVDEWVANLRAISREIARVLKPTGSYWLNVGDLYSRDERLGAPPKSLLLAPERLVRALQQDGWIVRNRVAWVKSNPLPSPVTDRLSNGWECLYHIVRERSYYYDLDAIRVPLTSSAPRPGRSKPTPAKVLGSLSGPRTGLTRLAAEGRAGHVLGKNPGDVWTLPPGRRVGSHRATFPEALVRRPILATVPPVICTRCGRAWLRSRARPLIRFGVAQPRPFIPCGCHAPTKHGIVLDPFCGSGTTLKVARELHRDAIGIELSPEFAELARDRAGFCDDMAEAA
jgi:site-specific DNA-methyltransferase (adenine-specific)